MSRCDSQCPMPNNCIQPCDNDCSGFYSDPNTNCKYNREVYAKYCECKKDCQLSPVDVYYSKQDAVCAVFAGSTLLGGTTYGTSGSAWLTVRQDNCCSDKKHFYVITAAANVMVPPGLVLATPPALGYSGFQIANVIYVSIQNVNGCCKNYVYQGILKGLDGTGNLAVIYIDENLPFNKNLPCLDRKKHPYLKLEDYSEGDCYISASRFTPTGVECTIMSKQNIDNETSISKGIITIGRYNPPENIYHESIVTDIGFNRGAVGAPLLNTRGKVIGMVTNPLGTTLNGYNQTVCTSEYMMCGPIAAVTTGLRGECNEFLEWVPSASAFGGFYRVLKSYLGLSWAYVNASTYNTALGLTAGPLHFKQIEGIVILGITTNSPFYPALAGATVPGAYILTHLNGAAIGQINPQISLSAITSRVAVGNSLFINASQNNCCDPCQTGKHQLTACIRSITDGFRSGSCISVPGNAIPPSLDNPFFLYPYL